MKKTLIMAISMIVIFSVAILTISSNLETQWQQPQSDTVNLTVNSPVEMVENEFVQYRYTTHTTTNLHNANSSEYKDGMISYAEAVSKAAEMIKLIVPFIEVETVTFETGVVNEDSMLVLYRQGNHKEEIRYYVWCWIDAYTGQLQRLQCDYSSENLNTTLHTTIFDGTDNIQNNATDKSLSLTDHLGYTDYQYISSAEEYNSCQMHIEAMLNNRKDLLKFSYNYDNMPLYKLYISCEVYQGI